MNWKKTTTKVFFITIFSIFIGLLSIFFSNYSYFKLGESEKGERQIFDSDLALSQSIVKSEDGYAISFLPQDEEIIVGFKNPSYIIDLEIEVDQKSGPFTITVDNGKKDYWGTKTYQITPNSKNKIILAVNGNVKDTKIILKPDSTSLDQESIIRGIKVDNTFDFNSNLFIVTTSLFLLIGFLICFKNYFLNNLDKAFLLLVLILGINSAILMPNYFSWDEREHFVKAYQIASFDLGIEQDKQIHWPENIDEFYYFDGKTATFDTFDEREVYYSQFSSSELPDLEYIHSTAASYMPTAYFPAAIGIFIAKILQLPFWMVFYAGRISSLVVYALIVSKVIKYIPCFKKTVFALGLLPTQVMLASSYSADPMTNASALALIGIFIFMKKSESQISLKTIASFVLMAAILCTCKMTYLPLFLLLFLIPNRQIEIIKMGLGTIENKQRYNGMNVKLICCSILCLALIVNLIYSKTHGLVQWAVPGVNAKDQLIFILTHPVQYFVIFINYIQSSALSYIQGSSINFAYAGMLPEIYTVFIICGLTILALLDDPDQLILPFNNKIVVAGIVLLSWGATVTALYVTFNIVGSISVLGVQGRYYAPLLLPTLLLLKSSHIKTSFNTQKMNLALIVVLFLLLLAMISKLFFMYSF